MSASWNKKSLALLVTLLLLDSVPAKGNFFSRILKRHDPDEKPAPSSVTSVQGSGAQVGSVISFHDGIPFAHLANSNKIPLIGYGVGNLQHSLIGGMVMAAMQESRKTRLIDTAHASDNEHLVAEGINLGAAKLQPEDKVEVHVVTKVYYTHLGYERTKLSVKESLEELQPALENPLVDLKIHILLHWPQCYDDIPWMDCAGDEERLPEHVKAAGPDPNLDSGRAWKESWKALEDMYLSDEFPIASIGVSNFHQDHLEELDKTARIIPHILQVNVWSLLYDPDLVDYCHKHRIHLQAYNALGGTVSHPERAPRAFNHLKDVAHDISTQIGKSLSPAQVVLAWLIQHGVSVIPRTTNVHRQQENSAVALSQVPAFNDHQIETIAHAVEAYLGGDDLQEDIHVSVTFHVVSKDIMLYWMGHQGEEVRIAHLKVGETFTDTTYPDHTFRTYDAQNKDYFIDHKIDASYGDHREIHVEL